MLAMVVGILLGYFFPGAEYPGLIAAFKVGSSVFLRLIKTLIVPLLFSTLVVGIAGHGDDMKKVGRLAFRSILYFEIVTTLALAVGLLAVNLVRPGDGISLAGAAAVTGSEMAATKVTFASVMEHMVPQSFFEAASKNEVLQIVVFAILFAVGLSRVQGRSKEVMLEFCESLSQVMFKFTNLVMSFAPIGIGCAIAVTIGSSGSACSSRSRSSSHALRRSARLRVRRAPPDRDDRARADPPVLELRQGTLADRLLDRELRGRAAEGDGEPREVRHPAAHHRVRAADRLLVQPRRLDALPRRRGGLRGPGGRHRALDRRAAHDHAHAHAHLQGRGRRAARLARDPLRRARDVRPPARGDRADPRRRRAHGHGPHEHQRDGQLPRDRGHGAGRRFPDPHRQQAA
jgi:hypothetical protein